MNNLMSYLFVALTILFTIYGQLILKARVLQAGVFPPELNEKVLFIFKLFLDPWVLSAFLAAFLASICWMAAMTRLPLSYAYPFTSLSFVLILVLSSLFFHEPITLGKTIGLAFIIGGIIISSMG